MRKNETAKERVIGINRHLSEDHNAENWIYITDFKL